MTGSASDGSANGAAVSDLREGIPIDQLDDRLAAAGLSDQAPKITAFLRDLNEAIADGRENPAENALPPGLADRIRLHAKAIGALLDSLRCDVDPAFRAESVAERPALPAERAPAPASPPAAVRAGSPTASADRPRPRGQMEAWAFPEPPLWLVVLGLLLVPVTIFGGRIYHQWTAVRKRRWRRFYCHIECAVLLPGTGPGRFVNGTLVDISQMGAKVFIGRPLSPDERSVDILFSGHRKSARVVWSNTLYFGAVFQSALPRSDLLALLRENRDARRAQRARSLRIS
ncbi:PilZ domain-containing protein [Jhaorihella thermophila]|uniref:PilZ domain-containing protein n=1 Tax=Jhaorihella thermophila TaxID=488547 RepID=UPI0011B0C8B1|nr:PilZ domain-containing protein [Jhaorihella thermophila]